MGHVGRRPASGVGQSSKQNSNTEVTEKKIKPQICTERLFVHMDCFARTIGVYECHIPSVQLCGLIFFSVISVLEPCLVSYCGRVRTRGLISPSVYTAQMRTPCE